MGWQSDYDGGSPILDYRVKINDNNLTHTVVNETWTIGDLEPGTIYTFVVQARNIKGYSDESEPLTVTTDVTEVAVVQETNTGLVIGIIVGCLILVAVLIVVTVCVALKLRKKDKNITATTPVAPEDKPTP